MKISENFLIDLSNDNKWRSGLKELYKNYSNIVEMTEEAYYHFLCTTPPCIQRNNSYVSGEPYSHTANEQGIYLCGLEMNNKFYAQMGTISDFLNKRLFR